MPTISVNRDLLFKSLGMIFTEEEFDELCFDFGIELDEVTSEKQMLLKEKGNEKSKGASEDIIYRIELPANRYDLLCLEGLVQALLIFLQKSKIPRFECSKMPDSSKIQKLHISPNTKNVRPFAVAAILRNLKFTPEIYDSFIDLQDKLHQNLCRKRSLVAIGTHDLDTIEGPFLYDARKPEEIKFVSLNQTKEFTAVELMEQFSIESHLKPYLQIIRDEPLYPIIYDKNGVVLSMPPIINGDHSKITLNTKNVFIECTATDLNKATIVLDTIVCMFSRYCEKKFIVEPVEIVNLDGSKSLFPKLNYRNEEVSIDYINRTLGIRSSSEEICELLGKMSLKSSKISDELVNVEVSPLRHDILHACDIVEDVGISYGYNNIKKTFPNVNTIGHQFFLNKMSDQLRFEISRCGYTEVLTFSLCSLDDLTTKIRKPLKEDNCIVKVGNPKTQDCEVARTELLPGLLKTIQANKKMPLPIRIFEISDVVLKDSSKDVGTRNERHICAVNYAKTPGFEVIHGLLDRIMNVLQVKLVGEKDKSGYRIEHYDDKTFFEGRCARIFLNEKAIGKMGVLHPEVVTNFELSQPCAALEITIDQFSN